MFMYDLFCFNRIGMVISLHNGYFRAFYPTPIHSAVLSQIMPSHLICVHAQRNLDSWFYTGVVQSRGTRFFLFMLNIAFSSKLMEETLMAQRLCKYAIFHLPCPNFIKLLIQRFLYCSKCARFNVNGLFLVFCRRFILNLCLLK